MFLKYYLSHLFSTILQYKTNINSYSVIGLCDLRYEDVFLFKWKTAWWYNLSSCSTLHKLDQAFNIDKKHNLQAQTNDDIVLYQFVQHQMCMCGYAMFNDMEMLNYFPKLFYKYKMVAIWMLI